MVLRGGRSSWIRKGMDLVPGAKVLGLYRFLPIFFLMGAALEFSMINWDVKGQVNFYRTFKRRRAEEVAAAITKAAHPEIEQLESQDRN